MDAEDLVIDDGGDREAVEAVDELLPKLERVAPLALVVEAVDAVDGPALVVATQQEEVLGILDLVSQQQADDLEVLLAAVHVVAEEEVVRLGREPTDLEDSQKVDEFSVDVTRDDEWRVQLDKVWL